MGRDDTDTAARGWPSRPLQPGTPRPAAPPAGVLIASSDPRHRAVIRGLIERTEEVRSAGFVGSVDELDVALAEPDVSIVVVDGPSLRGELRRALRMIRAARVSGTIVFADDPGKADCSVISPAVLDDPRPERLHALGIRLSLLATRSLTGPRTLSSTAMMAAVSRVRASMGQAGIREGLRPLADSPLELIALFGGRGAALHAAGVLARLSTVPVPVVLVVDDDVRPGPLTADAVRSMTRAPVHEITESTVLRRLPKGILVPTNPRGLFFDAHSVCVSRLQYESVAAPMKSFSGLGSTVAAVLLGGDDDALLSSLGVIANADAVTLALEPEVGPPSPVTSRAVKLGIAEGISAPELRWLLGHAVPLRD